MDLRKNNSTLFNLQSPWINNENPIWLASTIRIYRNIEKFNFPPKMSSEKRKQIISIVSDEMLNLKDLKDPVCLKAEDTSPLEKEFLYEHFLTPHSFQQAHGGEGFVFDQTGQFLTTINFIDHLQFQLTDCSGELENTWNRLTKIETFLGKTLNYSFSQKFGFLTSHFTECGTALLVSVFLQLPALIQSSSIDDLLVKHRDDTISLTGMQGRPHEIIGDLVVVQNNYTLGLNEETILSSLRSYSTKLLVHEKSTRAQIKAEQNANMKDKVSRAFGILIHSYQIETIEAMNAISLLKLGVDLGWLTGVSITSLNHLFFYCRRAHLLKQFNQEISQDELPHKRAEFIHAALKNAQLTI